MSAIYNSNFKVNNQPPGQVIKIELDDDEGSKRQKLQNDGSDAQNTAETAQSDADMADNVPSTPTKRHLLVTLPLYSEHDINYQDSIDRRARSFFGIPKDTPLRWKNPGGDNGASD